jgi:hypothetical protein
MTCLDGGFVSIITLVCIPLYMVILERLETVQIGAKLEGGNRQDVEGG